MTGTRNFMLDFLGPAITGLNKKETRRVTIALDAAIAYGALEHAGGNESLQNLDTVEAKYWDNVRRLQSGHVAS